MTNRQIVIVESDRRRLLKELKAAASLCQEQAASLHELASSIRDGAVRSAPDERGALTADLLGSAMEADAEDYLGLAAVIQDALSEDGQRIVFECGEHTDGWAADVIGTSERPSHSRFARVQSFGTLTAASGTGRHKS